MNDEIYERAAEFISDGSVLSACFAISKAEQENAIIKGKLREPGARSRGYIFSSWLKPINKKAGTLWYGPIDEESRVARSLGLLLMAELVKDGQCE